jgi:ketosteroid isomerase-like protein
MCADLGTGKALVPNGRGPLPCDTAREMSQENAQLVRETIDAVARQDLSRLIELTDPDVEWHSMFAQLGEGGVYRGHDGMRRYVKDLGDAWEFLRTQIDGSLAVGDVVLVVGRLRYRGKGSGVETESPAGYVTKFREGRMVYMRAFREPEQALLALGLKE